jgi:hypothetical protein
MNRPGDPLLTGLRCIHTAINRIEKLIAGIPEPDLNLFA